MQENHFRINVAKKRRPEDEYGQHFFYSVVRDEGPAKEAYRELRERFHPNEYNVTITERRGSGSTPDWA